MHDRLFALSGHVDRPAVELIARELGLDMVRFRADLGRHAHLREKYKDDVRVVYRHMTMTMHPRAALAAEAGVAAAEQGKFGAFHDQLFADLGKLSRADLERFARAAELDLRRFRARSTTTATATRCSPRPPRSSGWRRWHADDVRQRHTGRGARDAEVMDRLIEAHLARSRALVKAGVARADLYAVLMSMATEEDRADPSRVPSIVDHRVELRAEDRAGAVAAACRLHDVPRAAELAGTLAGDARRRAALVCAGVGIDLPR